MKHTLAGTILLIVLAGFFSCTQETQPEKPGTTPRTRIQTPRILSPEIMPDNRVVFRLLSKEAREVSLSGDWMKGYMASEIMEKNDTGLFTLTVGPLSPEVYTYSFTIDGVKVQDPNNTKMKRDGTRNLSYFVVPGNESDLYVVKDLPHGSLTKLWYDSPELKLKRRMYIYTPPGYESGKEKYPVLYLLHGGGGDEDAWTSMGHMCQIMDNLVAQGKVKPMIVVMPNGNPGQAAAIGCGPEIEVDPKLDRPAAMGLGYFEKSLVSDILPFVESHYRSLTDPENRALAGLSMGGIQTIHITLDNPGLFGYIGVFSVGLVDLSSSGVMPDPQEDMKFKQLKEKGFLLYWISCGKEDSLLGAAQKLRAKLDETGIKYSYQETSGGHTWNNWRKYLSEFAPLLFK